MLLPSLLKSPLYFLLIFFISIIYVDKTYPADENPEISAQLGHRDQITTLVFSLDGRYLASGSSVKDKTVKVWDVKSCRELLTLSGFQYPRDLAFHPNGYTLLTTSETIDEWDIKRGKWIRNLSAHDGDVNAITISRNGKLLASGGRTRPYSNKKDNTVKIWDWKSRRVIHTFRGHKNEVTSLAFSANGDKLASASWDGEIKVWDVNNRSELLTLRSKAKHSLKISFMEDDDLLVSIGSGQVIELWNIRNTQPIKTHLPDIKTSGYSGSIEATAINSVKNITATSNAYGSTITLRNSLSGKIIGKLVADKYGITSLAFSPRGRYLLHGAYNGTIKLWDINTQRSICSMKRRITQVNSIELSSNGKFLASGSDNPILWDLVTGQPHRIFDGHKDLISDISLSSDGQFLASSSRDFNIKVWSIKNGQEVKTLRRSKGLMPGSISFKPDSHILAAAYEDGAISVWDTINGKELWTRPKAHIASASTVSFSNDGQILASGGGGASTIYTNWQKKSPLRAALSSTGNFLSDISSIFFPVAKAQDSNIKPWDPETFDLKLWDAMSGRLFGSFIQHTAPIDTIALSPIGHLLASGSRDGTVRLWDLKNAATIKNFNPITVKKIFQSKQDSNKNFNAVAFNEDARLLAAAQSDIVRLYDLANNHELGTLKGHNSWITDVIFSPESHILFTSSDDGTIRLWRASDGKQLATLTTFVKSREWVILTPEGFFDGSKKAWKLLPFQFPSDPLTLYEPEQFFNQFYQPGLLADIFREGKLMREILKARHDPRANLDISKYKNSNIPTISLSPIKSNNISKREITITVNAKDTGSGLQDLRVFRNNSLVHFEHGQLKPNQKTNKYQIKVPIKLVAGKNEISAYVFNRDNIKSKDSSVVVTGTKKLKRKGTAYVIAIGINQYNNPKFINLDFAVADATAMNQSLTQNLNKLERYAKVISIPLLNHHATRKNILTTLALLSGKKTLLPAGAPAVLNTITTAQPEDAVIVFFSGHGTAKGDRYYLVPHKSKAISDLDLEVAFEKVDAGNIMLLIDACQSGQALEAEEKRRGPMNSRGLAQLAYEKGMYILAAAQSDEDANEFKKLGHGLLTYTLIEEGLKQGRADTQPKDKQLTAREWLDYAVQRVPQLTIEAIAQFKEHKGRNIRFEEQTVTSQAPRAYYRRADVEDKWLMSKQ